MTNDTELLQPETESPEIESLAAEPVGTENDIVLEALIACKTEQDREQSETREPVKKAKTLEEERYARIERQVAVGTLIIEGRL